MKPRIGLLLVAIGVLTLVASYIFGWTYVNAVQLTGLAFVVVGIILHVALLKRQSKY